jgi:hypothetical protein
MVDNQHKKITGYRDLTEEEIGLMNEGKSLAIHVGEYVAKLAANKDLDQRWVAIGRTDTQTAFMALIRAIARPSTF